MKRSILVAGAVAVLVAGIAVPAGAATAAPVRTAVPTSVKVSGGASVATITWSAPATDRRNPVRGYSVAMTPAERQPNGGVDFLSARTFSDNYGALTAGRTYSFAVRTIAQHGVSSAVKVSYTPPKPAAAHVESLYALNAAGAVVRRPVAGGTWTTVVAGGAGYAVDKAGTVYDSSTDGSTITSYAENGTTKVVATGLSVASSLQVDTAGDLFFVQDTSIVKLAKGATTVTTIGPATNTWVAAPDGTVTTSPGGNSFTTYPASGAASVTRSPNPYQFASQISADAVGNLFVFSISTGASGARSYSIVPAGSATMTTLAGPEPTGALAADGDFFALSITTWCAGATEGMGTCTPDRSVSSVYRRAANGSPTLTPITGLVLGDKGHPGYTAESAADVANDVFVAVKGGPNAGLVEVPAAGGAVRQLDTAQYSRLIVK